MRMQQLIDSLTYQLCSIVVLPVDKFSSCLVSCHQLCCMVMTDQRNLPAVPCQPCAILKYSMFCLHSSRSSLDSI